MALPIRQQDVLHQDEVTVAAGARYTGPWVSTAGVSRVTARAGFTAAGDGVGGIQIQDSVDGSTVAPYFVTNISASGDSHLVGAAFVRVIVDTTFTGADRTLQVSLRASDRL